MTMPGSLDAQQESKTVGQISDVTAESAQTPVDKSLQPTYEFGVGQFIKIVVFSFLTLFSAFLFGLKLRIFIEEPLFFLSFDNTTISNLIVLALVFLLFMVLLCITIVMTRRSLIEFIPVWLLSCVSLFIGLGSYKLSGVIIGGGFLASTLIFYVFVRSDIENSFTFSVRHAFSSLSTFLTIFFAIISTGYYFSCSEKLETKTKMLPDEVITSIYQYERRLVARQLGVDESEIESELMKLQKKGEKVRIGGVLGFIDISSAQEEIDDLYQLTKKQVSDLLMPFIRWISVGLAVLLFLSLLPFASVYNTLLKPIIWSIIELFVMFGIIKRVKEKREIVLLQI